MKHYPINTYLNIKLKGFKLIVPIVIALVSSFAVATLLFIQFQDLSKEYLKSLTPHLSVLIETGDYIELQRFVESASIEFNAKIRIIKNGEIIASTVSNTEVGQVANFKEEVKLKNINLIESIKRENGPILESYIVFEKPTSSIRSLLLTVMFSVFLASFIVISLVIDFLTRAVKKSLYPLAEIAESIKTIDQDELNIEDQKISELKLITDALKVGHHRLVETKQAQAESLAKDVILKNYQCLIHDLLNPIATLKSMTKALRDNYLEKEEQTKAVNLMIRTSEQILTLIQAAKNHMNMNLKLGLRDLRDCVSQSLEQAKNGASKGVSVSYDLQLPNRPVLRSFDETQLSRAISNVITNAIESSQKKVSILLNDVGDQACIHVSDDGKGVDQSQVALFLQGRGKTQKENHSGLGLYSANQIIKSHGGKIIYGVSQILGGAEFEIRI